MNIRKFVKTNLDSIIASTLNLGGTFLIVAGVIALPVHISFRLMGVGLCMILMWRAYSK